MGTVLTRKLRDIGGIINSTDLNYNFKIMSEDLQMALQGLYFNSAYSSLNSIEERDNIPTSELNKGLWVSVDENGKVYSYTDAYDVTINGTNRVFGPTYGDLPSIPYIINGDPSSGEWLNGWYIMKSNSINSYQYDSATMAGTTFNHGDYAVWSEVSGSYRWVRVPKWIEILDINSLLEVGLVGDLVNLNTTNKTNIVSAINEVNNNIGNLSLLETSSKEDSVSAINELNDNIGNLSTLKTENKSNTIIAINEIHDDVGTISSLTTTNKGTVVASINELDSNIGNETTLKTEIKTDLVSAINEIHDDLGTISILNTSSKDSAVSAINELDGQIGNIASLKTEIKTDTVSSINEIHDDLGTISTLSTTDKNNAVSAINELKTKIDSLTGSYIFIGRINLPTASVTQELLDARCVELKGEVEIQQGWVIVDNEQHQWYYSATDWIDMEQPNIYPASNTIMGTVIGSTDGDVSINTGVMTINHSVDSDKLDGQLATYYSTKEYADTKADKTNVLELNNTVEYIPTLAYHPATKQYVDDVSIGGVWGQIVGDISEQDDLNATFAKLNNILSRDNTNVYVPTLPYHPATKDYVDSTLSNYNSWGTILGDIADQDDLQNTLLAKQDYSTAWNQDNLEVGITQPSIPSTGYILWVDMNE